MWERDERRDYRRRGDIKQFTPGLVETGRESNPNLGDIQLQGDFCKFSGDYAVSKNPKGLLYKRRFRACRHCSISQFHQETWRR